MESLQHIADLEVNISVSEHPHSFI